MQRKQTALSDEISLLCLPHLKFEGMVQPLQASSSAITTETGHILPEKLQETSFGVLNEERNFVGQRSGNISSITGSIKLEHNGTMDSYHTDSEVASILQATNLKEDGCMWEDKSKDGSSVGITETDSIIGYSTDKIKSNVISLQGLQTTISSNRDVSYVKKPNIKITSTSRLESTRSESKNSKHTTKSQLRIHSSRSCRSELDLASISETNRGKLLEAFLPDIRRVHGRMSYEHRSRPFNLNHEGLKNVQIRAKTVAGKQRFLKEHRDETLGRGRKAASNITPRPAWVVKDVPVNAVHERLFPGEGPTMYAFVKRQQWDYMDRRPGMKRVLPKRAHTK